jgi:phosphoenolpyruvate carboxykinase (ATP)
MTAAKSLLKDYKKVFINPSREKLIEDAVNGKYALTLPSGTLVTWTPDHSTGRSPKDTYFVRRPESDPKIDWASPNAIGMEPETFDMLFDDAVKTLASKKQLYAVERAVGADSKFALPLMSISDNPLTTLFADNMFRPIPADIKKSIYADKPFLLVSLPYDHPEAEKYTGRLRKLPNGKTSDIAIVIDFEKRVGLVYGSAYMGTNKKLIFTVMNYYLPDAGILPLHCSANEGPDGKSALLLGLSGTGKTTLSADPERALLGDDEHGWSNDGVANFENGCYAKLINLNPEKEPEIFKATFHADNYLNHGAIVENMMVYPDGNYDLDDRRYTENSRASYPLKYLSNIKPSSCSGHPSTIIFLTADAYGVLPPVSKLTNEQAMLWFIMGYTSKLAGTEVGVTEPQSTFSRFFGEAFMARNPKDYADLLGKKLKEHKTDVFLVNTGWSGGSYGVGKRMDINLTRAMVRAALNGSLNKASFKADPYFKIMVPQSCPDVPDQVLNPVDTWADKEAFDKTAKKLAESFKKFFKENFDGKVDEKIAKECPGL